MSPSEGHTFPVANQPSETGESTVRTGVLIDWLTNPQLLRVGGMIGASLYFVLYQAYDIYFRSIGLAPGDVGLDQTTILLRAMAGVVVIFGVAVLFASFRVLLAALDWLVSLIHHRLLSSWRRRSLTDPRAAARLVSYVARLDRLARFPLPLPSDIFGVLNQHPSLLYPFRRKALLRTVIAVGSIVLVASVFAWVTEIQDRSQAVVAGNEVHPVEIGGLTVFDVAATPVQVSWIGSGSMPAVLSTPGIKFLGRGDSVVYFRTEGRTIAVPANNVVIRLITDDGVGGGGASVAG
jgi:hypothetical protein